MDTMTKKRVEHTIPQQAIDAAVGCRHGTSCLKTGKCGPVELCPVMDADGDNILYLHDAKPLSCPYRIAFGGKQVCTCPVHYELFSRYRV
jgi:hypothetical protein